MAGRVRGSLLFVLLQMGQLLSNAGTQSTAIAYPLLVLADTGSASDADIVAFARSFAQVVWALPAGLAVGPASG